MSWWGEFKIKGEFTRPKNLSFFVDHASDGSSLSSLVAIFIFAAMHLVWKKNVLQATVAGGAARAVWLWGHAGKNKQGISQTDIWTTLNVLVFPQIFLNEAQKNNISQVWIDVHPVIAGEIGGAVGPKLLENFCAQAIAKKIRVDFLGLSGPLFALSNFHAGVLKQLDQMYALIENIKPEHRPVGIQVDIEPAALKADSYGDANLPAGIVWKDAPEQIMDEFLQLIAKMRAKSEEKNAKLGHYVNLCFAVPFWWLGEPKKDIVNSMDGTADTKFGKLVLESGVDVAVMDYQSAIADTSKYAGKWISLASDLGQFAWIGLETKPDKDGTYFGQPEALLGDISDVSATFADSPGFATMAIDDANGYANLLY